jgi:hypothetical protein
MFHLSELKITKLSTKLTKEKEKENEREKEVTIYQKIVLLEALINWEGWKVSLFKGTYVARLPTLIHEIWLKGSQLTYIAKKIDEFHSFDQTKNSSKLGCCGIQQFL